MDRRVSCGGGIVEAPGNGTIGMTIKMPKNDDVSNCEIKFGKNRYSSWPWLFIILSMLAIAGFSNQEFERQDLSGRITKLPVLIDAVRQLPHLGFDYYGNGVYIDNRIDPVGFVQFIVRKLGHLFLYGCLSLGLLISQRKEGKISLRRFCLSAFLVLLVAGMDEFNQRFVMGRSGSVKDIGIDMTAFLLVFVAIFLKEREGRATKNEL